MSTISSLDGLGVFSIVFGFLVTVGTFWLGYRKAIGAREERLLARNRELVSAAIQRLAVERTPLKSEEFAAMRRATAYKVQIPEHQLHRHKLVLDLVTLEVIENRYLDKAAKENILSLIGSSLDVGADVNKDEEKRRDDSYRQRLVVALSFASIAAGITASAGLVLVGNRQSFNRVEISSTIDTILPLIATAVVAMAMILIISEATQKLFSRRRRTSREGVEANELTEVSTEKV